MSGIDRYLGRSKPLPYRDFYASNTSSASFLGTFSIGEVFGEIITAHPPTPQKNPAKKRKAFAFRFG